MALFSGGGGRNRQSQPRYSSSILYCSVDPDCWEVGALLTLDVQDKCSGCHNESSNYVVCLVMECDYSNCNIFFHHWRVIIVQLTALCANLGCFNHLFYSEMQWENSTVVPRPPISLSICCFITLTAGCSGIGGRDAQGSSSPWSRCLIRKHWRQLSVFYHDKILSLGLSILFQKEQMFWHMALSATHIL